MVFKVNGQYGSHQFLLLTSSIWDQCRYIIRCTVDKWNVFPCFLFTSLDNVQCWSRICNIRFHLLHIVSLHFQNHGIFTRNDFDTSKMANILSLLHIYRCLDFQFGEKRRNANRQYCAWHHQLLWWCGSIDISMEYAVSDGFVNFRLKWRLINDFYVSILVGSIFITNSPSSSHGYLRPVCVWLAIIVYGENWK